MLGTIWCYECVIYVSYMLHHSLRLIAPVIREHGVCYERAKFQDKLNDGTLTLERTQVGYIGAVACYF